MASLGNFNANDYEAGSFEPLPAGEYTAMVTESEIKATSAGTGSYLKCKITVLEGQYKNRTVFCNFNLENPSAEAVNIGKRQLADLCRAVDIIHPKDSVELHNKPFIAVLSVKPAEGKYNASNDVKGYKPIKAVAPVAATEEAVVPWKV